MILDIPAVRWGLGLILGTTIFALGYFALDGTIRWAVMAFGVLEGVFMPWYLGRMLNMQSSQNAPAP